MNDRAFDVRRVDPQISDQRLAEPLDGEFGGRIGGMRDAWPDRRPKAVDAAGVDDVALLGVLQHRQKRAGAVIDAAQQMLNVRSHSSRLLVTMLPRFRE